jgi:hypothetical protein
MVQRPGSLPEFEARFPDDAACARWLFEKRWPDGFRCPGCGHAKGWELGRGTLVVECARCHRQTSVTAGTVLHRSHLPLKLWFLAAWLVATHRNGISARQLWLQLGLGSYKTAWLLLRKLRRRSGHESAPSVRLARTAGELGRPAARSCRSAARARLGPAARLRARTQSPTHSGGGQGRHGGDRHDGSRVAS